MTGTGVKRTTPYGDILKNLTNLADNYLLPAEQRETRGALTQQISQIFALIPADDLKTLDVEMTTELLEKLALCHQASSSANIKEILNGIIVSLLKNGPKAIGTFTCLAAGEKLNAPLFVFLFTYAKEKVTLDTLDIAWDSCTSAYRFPDISLQDHMALLAPFLALPVNQEFLYEGLGRAVKAAIDGKDKTPYGRGERCAPIITEFLKALGKLEYEKLKSPLEDAFKQDCAEAFTAIFAPLAEEVIISRTTVLGYFQRALKEGKTHILRNMCENWERFRIKPELIEEAIQAVATRSNNDFFVSIRPSIAIENATTSETPIRYPDGAMGRALINAAYANNTEMLEALATRHHCTEDALDKALYVNMATHGYTESAALLAKKGADCNSYRYLLAVDHSMDFASLTTMPASRKGHYETLLQHGLYPGQNSHEGFASNITERQRTSYLEAKQVRGCHKPGMNSGWLKKVMESRDEDSRDTHKRRM